jgi:hypothetical protein
VALAALYERVADSLERSAQLAEQHARRSRDKGKAAVELERAKQARIAAQRGRALARGLQASEAPRRDEAGVDASQPET